MKHRTNKKKFGGGSDANKMMMRKLMKNFISASHIKTTVPRAKALKIALDRIVSKARTYTESNKNYLLRFFPEKKYQKVLFQQIGPALSKVSGGYVRIIKLNQRDNDGAMMAQIEWAHPVVVDWESMKPKKKTLKTKKTQSSTETKSHDKSTSNATKPTKPPKKLQSKKEKKVIKTKK